MRLFSKPTKKHLSGLSSTLFAGLLLSLASSSVLGANSNERSGRQQCDTVYEPSGITQLPDGRIIVVEDEKTRPFSILTLNDNMKISTEPLQTKSFFAKIIESKNIGALGDLEAVDVDDQGFVYAITSHSLTLSGKRSPIREKLVRFKVEGNRRSAPGILTDLKKSMISINEKLSAASKVFDNKDLNRLNIEGLSFDKTKETLLIGLRSPVINGKAVIMVMKNPISSFENSETPKFEDDPIYLDLDKGGIRAIAYDPKLNGYLIISRQEKKGEKFKLWLWNGVAGHAPQRIRIDDKYNLSKAEGITPIHHNGIERIMIAFDVGKKTKRKKGCYLFLTYDQLNIDPVLKGQINKAK